MDRKQPLFPCVACDPSVPHSCNRASAAPPAGGNPSHQVSRIHFVAFVFFVFFVWREAQSEAPGDKRLSVD